MTPESSAELFALVSRLATESGQEPLRGIAVGGASDGNYTAAVGCPTLDGLGGVGAGAHADSEYVEVARMVPRARLLARLIEHTANSTHDQLKRPRRGRSDTKPRALI
ncbi:M20/M25/M40 family metallo-hydrolase [Streptomyces herbicida]|uniref:M20/M25/M40 family metallo-hydrolase n=1 Tax=Streptomyces herbicida TaxID=3065675 RepID=UPI00292E505A|nr:M20/M25/M40 family metallo-hydrolase [Streptomyces sp. NEAU-HV9]